MGAHPDLRLFGQPVLRKAALPVEEITPELVGLADKMVEVMSATDGLAVAAPQVGVGRRLFVCRDESLGVRVVINPEVVERSEELVVGPERCLSLPGVSFDVSRPRRVTLVALDLLGIEVELVGTDMVARCWLHEIDHLDGVLVLDRVSRQQRRNAIRELEKLGLRAA